jgi:hypothetical protein
MEIKKVEKNRKDCNMEALIALRGEMEPKFVKTAKTK